MFSKSSACLSHGVFNLSFANSQLSIPQSPVQACLSAPVWKDSNRTGVHVSCPPHHNSRKTTPHVSKCEMSLYDNAQLQNVLSILQLSFFFHRHPEL